MTKGKILSVFEDINLMYNNPNMYDVLSKMLDKLVEDSKKSVDPEKCGDCVIRQAVIDALMELLDRPNHAEFLYMDEICRALNHLPSVEPERKTGKWVHMVGWWECNQCHAEYTDMPTCMGKVIYEYCPNCGARMEVDG